MHVGTSGIVGMDDDDAAGALGDRFLQRGKIDLPAVIVDQGIRDELDVLQVGEKFE